MERFRPGSTVLLLFSANVWGALIGLGTNLFLAHKIGGTEYGRYAFTIALVAFCAIFFDFGYFSAGARLLAASAEETEQKELIAGMCLIGAAAAVLFVLSIFLLSFFVDSLFPDSVSGLLRDAALVSPGLMAPFFLEQVLKGSGEVKWLGIWQVGNKLLGAAAVGALLLSSRLNTRNAVLVNLGVSVIFSVVILMMQSPRFHQSLARIKEIACEHKRFGRPLYRGRSFSVLSYKTDSLFIAHFWGAQAVGYYNLAVMLGNGISMYSQALAASEFRAFAGLRRIRRTVHEVNAAGVLTLWLGVITIGAALVWTYLGPEYHPVIFLLAPAGLAAVFQGLYQPFNAWLLANGCGTELKSLLIFTGIANVAANTLLIPVWGPIGATLASIIGMGVYLYLSHSWYMKVLRTNEASI